MLTDPIYGAPPADLGLIDLSPVEMMCWVYCPIKLPGQWSPVLPENLEQFDPLVEAVFHDLPDMQLWQSYVYITAKTLFCGPGNPGNRPGWHSDGFLTDDLNYIWADANPTVFWVSGDRVSFTADHVSSLGEMDQVCEGDILHHCRYPLKHLLRLDQTVMHKVDTDIQPGVRTFVKISVSKDRYALKGDSINHRLEGANRWQYQDRQAVRNDPAGAR